MSKRAEERALEAYPIEICGYVTECRLGAKPQPQDWNEERRKCFQEGYEQAEKDIIHMVKTWLSEIHRVCDITDENGYRIELRNLIASFKKTLEEE